MRKAKSKKDGFGILQHRAYTFFFAVDIFLASSRVRQQHLFFFYVISIFYRTVEPKFLFILNITTHSVQFEFGKRRDSYKNDKKLSR